MYFLIFTESVMDKMVQICNRIFETKENISSDEEELNKLREEITQKQINLTLAKTENKSLKETAVELLPKYEETLGLIEESEKKCAGSIMEAQKLKESLEHLQEEIEMHEKTELQLKKQIVTEEEFNNLKSTLESFKKEDQNLEEIDDSNGLFEQKQHIEQLRMCLQELNYLDLPEDLFSLSALRVQLQNEQQDVEYALSIQQSNEGEMEQLRIQLEKQQTTKKAEKAKLQETLKKLTETALIEESTLRKNIQQSKIANLSNIDELQKSVKEQETNLKQMKNNLVQQHQAICKMQEAALQKFECFLKEVNMRMGRK